MALLPECLRVVGARASLHTQHNKNLIVNLALSYASRDEITNAVREIVDGVNKQLITAEDISAQLVTDCLYTSECTDLDMIIRSSGETRLSDFLMWQSASARLMFIKPLWPECTIADFCSIILQYQKQYKHLGSLRKELARLEPKHSESNRRVPQFLDRVKELRQRQIETWAAL